MDGRACCHVSDLCSRFGLAAGHDGMCRTGFLSWPRALLPLTSYGLSRLRCAPLAPSCDLHLCKFKPFIFQSLLLRRFILLGQVTGGLVHRLPCQQRPGDASHLVGQRCGGDIDMLGADHPAHPCARVSRACCAAGAQDSPGAVDEQPAQIGIAALSDPSQGNLAATAVDPRGNPYPGGKAAARTEGLSSFAYRCDDGRGANRTDASNRCEPAGCRVVAAPVP